MYIKLCDRCGRVTSNKVAFLLPNQDQSNNGFYQWGGVWFGEQGVCLCNNCLDDFEKFRTEHERFNNLNKLEHERKKDLINAADEMRV